ncbi:DUF4148 domain-containing protein [Paraburkholderia sp. BCC1876]|uniref:DUF4148 domain-containing protein n=1 Tax=Paraburkholderia sp. BCC1876 TaxID=2676303 RepID=UPI00158FA6E2|nr:DUF4148 domain-containing protein [Paraburkholderia sp. BCC1876]
MNAMKLSTLSVAALLSIGALSQTAQAQAQAPGKSRAQVHQELIKAQHDGSIPLSKTQYPPNEAVIAQNKQTHAGTRHKGETAPALDQHDAPKAR